ncbi:fungal-specific transcription factor domain-containing protein [Colletotrichum godetiae]|uniref:Fungal-specific transcription factor domain-containing protein n=1 Tax=Colletotrichum godetiae TaxID=1209918 RepID=A0AAJ0AAA1_9PEZI|nr:fungal-specific transcription factor domain-containing protein [Colletotrichum godetiae]KAK1657907.1 fungal-specific transcription factor domain-containing protein [Colletotrichum godetiae]
MSAVGRKGASSPTGSASSQPSKKPRTNGRACVTCHQRKVRCDILEKGTPCSKCEANNISDCRIFEKKKTRSSTRVSQSPNVSIQPRTTTAPSSRPTTTPIASNAASPWAPVNVDSRPASAPGNEFTAQTHYATEVATRNLADFLDREETGYQDILPSGRLYFIGTEFSNLNYLVRQRSQRPDQHVLHFGSHPLAPRMSSVPPEALELPTKALADELVQAYFVHINRGIPIVDEEFFMKKYNNTETSDDFARQRPLSLLLLNAILLVGAHVLSNQRDDLKALKAVFFKRAKALFDCRFEQHRETYLQAAILLTWQCDDLEDVISNSWYWVGIAARTAYGMGMHRDAMPSGLNVMDKRLWRRLWWTLYQYDVLVSMAHGRPQAISLDDSDVPFIEECHLEDTPGAEASFIVQHTQLCIIFAKVMKKRVALRCKEGEKVEATRKADIALAELVTNLPERLQLSSRDPDIWQAMFHITYNNFLILLHRPPPRAVPGPTSTEAGNDLSICSDAAATIASIFESLRKKEMLAGLWLPSLHMLFTALVHTSSQMHSSNPIVAAKSKRHTESMIQTLHAMKSQWLYAQSLLNLFEPKRPRNRGLAQQSTRPNNTGNRIGGSGEQDHSRITLPTDILEFEDHAMAGPSTSMGDGNSARPLVSGTTYGSQSTNTAPDHGLARDPVGQYAAAVIGNMSQGGQPYNTEFGGDNMGLTDADTMDMLQLPSALEFLLAGAGNNFDF